MLATIALGMILFVILFVVWVAWCYSKNEDEGGSKNDYPPDDYSDYN